MGEVQEMPDTTKPQIAVVDDSRLIRALLAELLEKEGYAVQLMANGEQALRYLQTACPDLILLDVDMPGMDGYAVCEAISKTQDLPIIFLTGRTDQAAVAKGFAAGAIDYVKKPFNEVELSARIRTQLRLKYSHDQIQRFNQELQQAYRTIETKNRQLEALVERLEILARTDGLTGLANRRYMMERLQTEWMKASPARNFSVVLFDVDHFKAVNDTFGHAGGDSMLREVAALLRQEAGVGGLAARWGGEEFLLLVPGPREGAEVAAERVRLEVEKCITTVEGQHICVTITAGLAQVDEAESVEALLKLVDERLYCGKQQGRNRVVAG